PSYPRLTCLPVRIAEHVDVALVVDCQNRRVVGIASPLIEPDLGPGDQTRVVVEVGEAMADVAPRARVNIEGEGKVCAVCLCRIDRHWGNLLGIGGQTATIFVGVIPSPAGDLIPNALEPGRWSCGC